MPRITARRLATPSASIISSLTARAPVWSQGRSEEDLLKLYAEEIAMVEALEEADVDAGHVTAASSNDFALLGAHASVVHELMSNEQQVCRMYPAQATTLLFDISAEVPHNVSRMLGGDFSENHTTQETACEHAFTRPGRSMTHPPSVCDGAERIDVQDEVQPLLDTQAVIDRVLSLIPGQVFLPGIDHVANVEVRSASIAFDNELQVLQQATAQFLADRCSSEYLLFDDNVDLALPGENFLSADNTTDVALSTRHPAAKSLLTVVDELVESDTLVEDITDTTSHPNQHLLSYPAYAQQYFGYTALDQLLGHANGVSPPTHAQSRAANDVLDICDIEAEQSSTTQLLVALDSKTSNDLIWGEPRELNYFDAYTQQPIAYTAFNQLLSSLDDDETLPRIHHSGDDFDEDHSDSDAGVLEVGELSVVSPTTESLPDTNDFSSFDFDFNRNLGLSAVQPALSAATAARSRSIESLHSYSFSQRRKVKRRAFLAIDTKLAAVLEVSSDEDESTSSASSDSSIEFTGQRGFVQELPVRRANFLDDKDSDDDVEGAQSTPSPVSSDTTASPRSAHTSHVVVGSCELFSDRVWHAEPCLLLKLPLAPAQPHPHSPPTSGAPAHRTVETIETEILGLIAHTFECIGQGNFSHLQSLGSDLQWASNAITEVCPRLGLVTQLSTVVEILLERIVGLSSN